MCEGRGTSAWGSQKKRERPPHLEAGRGPPTTPQQPQWILLVLSPGPRPSNRSPGGQGTLERDYLDSTPVSALCCVTLEEFSNLSGFSVLYLQGDG